MAQPVVVIYKSRTGFTKQYAEWIAEDLAAEIYESSAVSLQMLADYETIIYGGNLHAAGIDGLKFIKKNLGALSGKRIFVFACGASFNSQKVYEEIASYNFTPAEQKQVEFFYLQGGFNFKKLPFFDKILMTLFKWRILVRKALKKQLAEDEKLMLTAYKTPADFSERSSIQKLLAAVRR